MPSSPCVTDATIFDRSRVNIGEAARFLSACREQFDLVLLDPPFHNGMTVSFSKNPGY